MIEPRNDPAAQKSPHAFDSLYRKLVEKLNEENALVTEQVRADHKAMGAMALDAKNRIEKMAWLNDPAKQEGLEKVLGLQKLVDIFDRSETPLESMPEHIKTLAEKVDGLQVLVQEAESHRPRNDAEDVLDPRAEYIAVAADRLKTDARLRAALTIDPRLDEGYLEITDKYIRQGIMNLTREEQRTMGRAHSYAKLLSNNEYHGPWTPDVKNALAPDVSTGAGLLVSPTMDTRIRKKLTEFSPIVGLTNRVPIGSNRYEWMQETGALPTSTTVGPHGTGATANTNEELWEDRATDAFILEVYTPLIRAQVEDSSQDLISLLTDLAARQMGKKLSGWVVTGNGVNQPYGVTMDSGVTSVNTGVADEVKIASLLFLMTQLKGFYRRNAQYVVGDDCYTAMVLELDGEGRPKWQPSLSDGMPPNFAGYRVHADSYFSSATTTTINKVTYPASAKVAAFADWSQFTIMPERHGTRFVRSEVATTAQQIDIAFFQRIGFAVDLAEAGRLLNVSV